MGFFSEELRLMDRNLVKYMIEEQQQEIDALNAQKEALITQTEALTAQTEALTAQTEELAAQNKEKDSQIEILRQRILELEGKSKPS